MDVGEDLRNEFKTFDAAPQDIREFPVKSGPDYFL